MTQISGPAFGCAIFSFATSFVAYIITMGVGWALSGMVPTDLLIRAAAIVCTIPVLSVVAYAVLVFLFGGDYCKPLAGGCMLVCVFLAWLFELVGGIMFIVAGARSGDQQQLAFGVTAGVFSIVASFSCCGSISALQACSSGDKPESKEED